jgi:hypothetical protein
MSAGLICVAVWQPCPYKYTRLLVLQQQESTVIVRVSK